MSLSDRLRHVLWPCALCAALIVGFAPAAGSEDWPQFRGPGLQGRAPLESIEGAPSLALRLAWRRELGHGYSSISTWNGSGYTMASLGGADAGDFVIAFDLATGAEHFRYRVGDRFKGRDGSSDGPISTPAVGGGRVFAISPDGELVALDARNGTRRWSHSIPQDLQGRVPFYGFSTSPVIADDLVIVETGGPGGTAVTAFDGATGRVVWQGGEGEVEAQIPIVVSLHGQRQVLAATTTHVYGFDPRSGRKLWSIEQEGKYWYAQLTLAGEEGLLVTHNEGAVYYAFGSDSTEPEKRWSSRVLRAGGLNPRMPAYRDGYFYGHTMSFLSCIEAATGKLVWRSRPPGGQSLIEVGGHMVLVGRGGALVTAALDPEGYRETGRIEALEPHRVYTPPSYADGRLYVRDLRYLAAIDLVGESTRKTATEGVLLPPPDSRFAGSLARVRAARDKPSAIDAFFDEVDRWPLVEGNWLHFAYRGDVEDIAIAGDVTGYWPALPMNRVEGSDLHHASFDIGGAQRIQYRFRLFEEQQIDPLNPAKVETPDGTFSVWHDPGWREPDYIATSPSPERGRVDRVEFELESHRRKFHASFYTPPGTAARNENGLPLVWIPQGREAIEHGRWIRALDNLYAESRIPPAIFVFADLPKSSWWEVFEPLARTMLAEILLPYIEEHYPVSSVHSERVMLAQSHATRTLLVIAATEPGVAGRIALQSPKMDRDYRPRHWPRVLAAEWPLHVRIDYGTRDGRDPDHDIDVARDSLELAEQLRAHGKSVTVVETPGGHGWSRWRTQLPAILDDLLGRK